MAKTYEQLAKIVADEFKADMKEYDFDTFAEMKRCYQWTTSDIKDEVDYILREHGAFIDEYDRTDVFNTEFGDPMPYKEFSAMFRKLMKDTNEDEDE